MVGNLEVEIERVRMTGTYELRLIFLYEATTTAGGKAFGVSGDGAIAIFSKGQLQFPFVGLAISILGGVMKDYLKK